MRGGVVRGRQWSRGRGSREQAHTVEVSLVKYEDHVINRGLTMAQAGQ